MVIIIFVFPPPHVQIRMVVLKICRASSDVEVL